VHINRRQLGNSANTLRALETAFGTGADFVILGEDDAVVSQDALEFLTWGAERFADDRSVMGICTFNGEPPGALNEVRRAQWFFPPVWGIWRDRFEQVAGDWPSSDTTDWAWYLHRVCMKPEGMTVIHPVATRSQQVGEWGTFQRGSLQASWDRQQFRADIEPQDYKELPGIYDSNGERLA
jgi:hypothetical protein